MTPTLLFALAMVVAMLWDVATYEIPDTLSVLLVLVAVAGLLSGDGGAPRILLDFSADRLPLLGQHALAGLTAFAAGAALFFLGQWGGGDVKFLGATGLWFGWGGLPAYALTVAIIGGGVTLLLLAFRALPLPASLREVAWLARLHRRDQGVPYGVALGLGGLVQLELAAAAIAGG